MYVNNNYVYLVQECFMPGFVVELRSKVSGKKLALGKDGLVNCSGDGGATCKSVLHSCTPYLQYCTS